MLDKMSNTARKTIREVKSLLTYDYHYFFIFL